jgi:pimeloyl-ACP methyl ester carboxylesterase/membrane protein DedA with SNARE-associated domain
LTETPQRRRFRLRWVFAVYLVLLGASTAVRYLRPGPATPPDGLSLEIGELVSGAPSGRPLRIAWKESGSGPGVLFLHGSPGSRADWRRLIDVLPGDRRHLAPDLPGFGDSSRTPAELSFDAQARHLAAWLDAIGVGEVHLVAYSLGGGPALSFAQRWPERVRSLTLLASIGVQELEWFGDHHFNRALHALQYALLLAAIEATPHFGLFDGRLLDRGYARSFLESDQRPLRAALGSYAGPLLILHGERDALVPTAIAHEHARIAPQAELVLWPDQGHLVPMRAPQLLVDPLRAFWARVEAGTAQQRADVAPDLLVEAQQPFDPRDAPQLGGFPKFVTLGLLAASTLVSEDLACIGAGVLVSQGRLDFWLASLACFLGICFGDFSLFLAGRLFGRRALRAAPLRWFLDEAAVTRCAAWFHRRGAWAILASRFLPGTRLPTYFAAGSVGASFWRFAFYFVLAGLAWTPALVWVAGRFEGELVARVGRLQGALPWALAATVLVLVFVLRVLVPLASYRGRRTLVGRWTRRRHWEFWPAWAFYPPIVLYVLYLGFVRYRRPGLFAAANPGIELGGFVDESKRAILERLGPARIRVARWTLLAADLDVDQRLTHLEAFRRAQGLTWPLVLKPDAGQRGAGVVIAKDAGEARAALEASAVDLIAQEYAPGREYGVFYARRAGEERGQLISITDKRLARVVGDGRRNIERLVLEDARAVALAPIYLARLAERAAQVPAAGEEVLLGEVGTHARGAIFLDGAHLYSEALLEAVDELSRTFEGFHFGRYDLRAPDEQALREGRDLVAIELNGVTSESTHIYDRRHGLLHAWRTLRAQWRLCFEIGAANAQRGAAVPGVWAFFRALFAYRRRARGHAPTR